MTTAALAPSSTALVLIDLQNGIVNMPLEPRTGVEVVETSAALAKQFRDAKAPVVLVHVGFAPDMADSPPKQVDQPMPRPEGGYPPDWSDLHKNIKMPGDLVVLKKQWGAFYGTDLDLQLRRRGVRTIVLGGIATNFGVESTARAAWEHGYDVIIAEDACASRAGELHSFAVKNIFPRISRVVKAADIKLEITTTDVA